MGTGTTRTVWRTRASNTTPELDEIHVRFAKVVFLIAGIYGIIVIAPQLFLENAIVRATGPITHPEHFYGFLTVTLPWQVLFLIISRDPVRMRPAMWVAVLEKVGFPIAAFALYAQGRVAPPVLAFACIDLVLAVLFTIAFVRTPSSSR
jgi:uncharacterized membrane protein